MSSQSENARKRAETPSASVALRHPSRDGKGVSTLQSFYFTSILAACRLVRRCKLLFSSMCNLFSHHSPQHRQSTHDSCLNNLPVNPVAFSADGYGGT